MISSLTCKKIAFQSSPGSVVATSDIVNQFSAQMLLYYHFVNKDSFHIILKN